MKETEKNEPCCEKNNASPSCQCSSNDSDCGKPAGRKLSKVIICLVVLLAAISITAFRAVNAGNNSNNDTATFGFGQSSFNPTLSKGNSFSAEQNLGEYLGSLADLNAVAMDNDTVFVYIPASGNVSIDNATKTAVIKFQQDLKNNNITAGLYTLWHESLEYTNIARQVELPIFFIASKGASAVTIPAKNVDEYTLYQAFQACCDPSPGCCP